MDLESVQNDGAGRLIQRIDTNANGVQTSAIRFIHVDGEIYVEADGAGNVQDRYVRDDAGMLLGRIETRNMGLQRDVYATDRIGSVAAVYRLESGSATAVRRHTYLDLRRLEGTTWGAPMGGSLTEPFTHSGRYTDPSVGLQWDGSRWLDPKSKRFMSETPFGRANGTSNLYSYANNSWANPPEQKAATEEPRDSFTRIWSSIDSTLGAIQSSARDMRESIERSLSESRVRAEMKTPVPAPRKADLEGQGLYFYLKAREGGYDDLGENLAGSTAESVVSFVEGTSGLTRSWMSGDPTTGVKAEAFALGTMQRSTPVSLSAFYDRASLWLEAYGEERRGRVVSNEELELREFRLENNGIWLETGLGHQADSLDSHYAELGRKSAPITEGLVTTLFSFGVGQVVGRGSQALAWAGREAAAVGRASKRVGSTVKSLVRTEATAAARGLTAAERLVTRTMMKAEWKEFARAARVEAKALANGAAPAKLHPTGIGGGITDAHAEALYAAIRRMRRDVAAVANATGWPERMVRSVKRHLFYDVHEVAVGANQVQKMRFTADSGIAEVWTKTAKGSSLSPKELETFRMILAHEYVERALMKEGFPFRSAHPEAWINEYGGYYPTKNAHGAHDLAPRETSDPFGHWKRLVGP